MYTTPDYDITYTYLMLGTALVQGVCTGCVKKSSPLTFFAVFSATALNLNAKFYTRD